MVVGYKKFDVVSYVIGGSGENFRISPPWSRQFVRFQKQTFEYTDYIQIDRIFSSVFDSMFLVNTNSVTNLFRLAFQQFKSIGSGVCYPLGNF